MLTPIRIAKTVALAIAIVAGFALQSVPAEARDIKTTVVAGGCFWCVEADFERVTGVVDVVSGYSGGSTANPTYKEVTGGGTGHYEVVQITYDADRIGYDRILELFFRSVDPTDAGGQFCDRGDSYRTAIFVRTAEEERIARRVRSDAQAELGRPVVTPILSADPFYEAEDYHQNYYRGQSIVLTRRGPKSQAEAYKFYRSSCGRDARIQSLWGPSAPFIN